MKLILVALSFIAAVSLYSFTISDRYDDTETWVIKSSSSLKVDGKTNINSFSCVISTYGKTDTMSYQKKNHPLNLCTASGYLKINVNNFDCHHKVMTKDLQKTLKSEEFPYMHIRFLTFSKSPAEASLAEKVSGNVEIELAGIKRTFEVHYQVKKNHDTQMQLKGTRAVLFSDFNLKPPSKLGGAIKVKNELDVEFNLHLNKLD